MVDTHCHLNDHKFSDLEIEEVVDRANMANISTIICNGGGWESSKKAIEIANKHEGVFATVGIHPEEAEEFSKYGEEEIKRRLLKLCDEPKVVAIGEAGLDFVNPSKEEVDLQLQIFKVNTWLCEQTGLPLVVHNRNADEQIKKMLEKHKSGVQLHCFVQEEAMMNWAIQRNWYISFGGILTFKKSEYLRRLAQKCPKNRVLSETDSPYLAPEPMRGTRNEPVNVRIVVQALASAWNMSAEETSKIIWENTKALFTRIK